MAYWTIIGVSSVVPENKTFSVTLDTENNTWNASGPDVDSFFTTKSGLYEMKIIPAQGCYLNRDSRNVAFFRNLVKTSLVGATGDGAVDETGLNFKWTLDSQ
jgi:hypothetical protein